MTSVASKSSILIVLLSWLFAVPSISQAQTQVVAKWTKMRTANWIPSGPGPRSWSNLFYDSRRQRIALFGGSAGGGYKRDVWHYNLTNDLWTAIEQPAGDCPGHTGFSGPDGRDAHSSAYDPINDFYWSVSGGGYKCGPFPSRTAGAGTTSSVIVDPTLTSSVVNFYKDWTVTVGSRQSFITAYDPATKKLTLQSAISGLAQGKSFRLQVWTNSQSWYFDPDTKAWGNLESPHWGSKRPSPVLPFVARNTPGFAYSTRDNVFVHVGGGLVGNGSNDTWVLDPRTKSWTQKLPNSSLGTLFKLQELTNHFVYDQANDVFILFGGRCADTRCAVYGAPAGDTWAYKLSTNTWTKKTPAVSPPRRMTGSMSYDAASGLVVLFGGATTDIYKGVPATSARLNDLWVYRYTTNTWTKLNPATSPSSRYLAMMAYDPVAKKHVMYGGGVTNGTGAEVWTLELTTPSAGLLPSAQFSVTPTSGTTTTDFLFNGSASSDLDGSITRYTWNFGDQSSASGVTASHRYNAPGTYAARLTVTDNSGATATRTQSIVVSSASGGPSITFSVQINGTVSNGAVSRILANGSELPFSGSGSSFSAALPQATTGTTNVKIEASGTGGSASRQFSVVVP